MPSVRAASTSATSSLRVVLAMIENLLEQRADDDDRDFRTVVDAEDRDGQRAECRRRQIAEEFDERLDQPRETAVGAAKNAQRHADDRRDQEAPENDLDAVPEALMQPLAVLVETAAW